MDREHKLDEGCRDFAELIDTFGPETVAEMLSARLTQLKREGGSLVARVAIATCALIVAEQLTHAPWPRVAELAGCTISEARAAVASMSDRLDAGVLP